MKRKEFDRDKFISETWPEALESGEFKQGQGTLYKGPKSTIRDKRKKEEEYCCLGVACELLSRMRLVPRKEWLDFGTFPEKISELLDLDSHAEYRDRNGIGSLVGDNGNGKTFKQIARKIRQISKSKKYDFTRA